MDAAITAGLISAGAGLAGAGGNIIAQSNLNKKNRLWSEAMTEKAWEHDINVWNMQNAYNTPLAQKQRLINAGLNPLYYGLDGNSAGAASVSPAQSYEGKSMPLIPNLANDYFSGKMKAKQLELMEKQEDAIDADITKKKSDTKSVDLDNQFKEDTLAAREEGIQLANDATKETISKIREEKNKAVKEIDLLIKQAATEDERKTLVAAQAAVQKATEKQILELLPVQQKLMEAQTLAQQAAAAANFASAAYQNGLIDAGQIDEICRKAKADADSAEAKAAIDEFASACKTGNPYRHSR